MKKRGCGSGGECGSSSGGGDDRQASSHVGGLLPEPRQRKRRKASPSLLSEATQFVTSVVRSWLRSEEKVSAALSEEEVEAALSKHLRYNYMTVLAEHHLNQAKSAEHKVSA